METTLSTLRELFGNPQPPTQIWEQQFDGFDKELREIAQKPWEDIRGGDLWYYFHDLAYVELQSDLFEYLFPVCLYFWYRRLMEDKGTDRGDSDFQWALYRGNVINGMLDDEGREKVYHVIHDGLLHRLDKEGWWADEESYPTFNGLNRFNSTGMLFPIIDRIWESWWSMSTKGRAICALHWAAGLIYNDLERPPFWDINYTEPNWPTDEPLERAHLYQHDAEFVEIPWQQVNIDFLRRTLSADYLHVKLEQAAQTLESGPKYELARELATLAQQLRDVVNERINWLLATLSSPLSCY